MKRSFSSIALLLIVAATEAQQTVSDDFERANLGSNWTVYFGSGNVEIVNSSDLGYPASGYFTIVGWTANSFQADQYSEIIISPNKDDSMLCQAFVRRRSSDFARYGFHWNPAYGGRYEIKYDGVPTPQVRILDSLVAPVPLDGDTLRIEISGMTISGYHNGSLVLQASDTAYSTSSPITTTGVPGIAFRFNSVSYPAPYPSAVIEEWNGGNLTATAVSELKINLPLAVYPNPASSVLNIPNKNFSYAELFSCEGKMILKTNRPTMNLISIENGMYFLKIASDKNIYTQKIIVQH